MSEPTIRMLFPDPRSAYDAFETLQELGYDPEIVKEGDRPELAIHIERADVQSALEIAHFHGGHLLERDDGRLSRFEFDMDAIHIPAHTVTEDFSDRYTAGATNAYLGDEIDAVQEGYRDSVY